MGDSPIVKTIMVLETKEKLERRWKILRIANPVFVSLVLQGAEQRYRVTANGLPSDAKIISVRDGINHPLNPQLGCFDILIESSIFPPIKEDQGAPFLIAPTVTRI